jgi:hypothetical protein
VETAIVIGLGEISKPLYGILKISGVLEVYGYDIRSEVSPYKPAGLLRNPGYLHVVYLYSEHFIDYILGYVELLHLRD